MFKGLIRQWVESSIMFQCYKSVFLCFFKGGGVEKAILYVSFCGVIYIFGEGGPAAKQSML